MSNITKEELETMQELVHNYNDLKVKMADAFIAQNSYMARIEELKSRYIQEEKKLLEKYGEDIAFNIKTGEINNVKN